VGAAYNGQNIKALTHFLAVAGLWVMADIFGMPLEIAFGLGCAGFYFYSIYDAFQSAQRLRRGEDLSVEDERLKLFLRQRMNLFGALLIGVGALAMLDFWVHNLLHRIMARPVDHRRRLSVWSYYRRAVIRSRQNRLSRPRPIRDHVESGPRRARDLASNQQYRER